VSLAVVILALVTEQRLCELAVAHRNAARLLAKGGVEHGAGHYPAMIAIHAAWLAGLWLLAPAQPVNRWWLAVYIALQGARAWVLLTLGRRWTTRVIVLPGVPLVESGPYRFLRHPNYAVVAAEVAVLPLVFGLPWYALVFSALNALVLAVRVRCEEAALAAVTHDPR
jgi:methyltransferase